MGYIRVYTTVSSQTLGLLIVALISWVGYALFKYGRRPNTFPPGPPTLPILGNLHQIPRDRPFLKFQEWAEIYGPIYSLILGSRRVVVLNTDQAVKDLLDKKGSIYSSRPNSYITDISTGGMNFGMMPCNDIWRLCHRILDSSLNKAATRSYTYSTMTQIALGFRTVENHDPKLKKLSKEFNEWSELIGESTTVLLDIFPPLRHLPDILLPVKQRARSQNESMLHLFLVQWHEAKQKITLGISQGQPCVANDIFKMQRKENLSDDLASWTCGILIAAGSETITKQLSVFIQAMVLYPNVQRVAQAEIDQVCGNSLPEMDDQEKLPYLRAMSKEVLRWIPAAILGIPHATLDDDVYMGYHIPKETVVIMNTWAIHNDPQRFSNPRTFDPTRYLDDRKSARESALWPNVEERDHFGFGAGRRLCPGIDLAESSLFLSMSRILWAFDISKAIDSNGNEVTPDPDNIVGGLAAMPAKFPAHISARNAQRENAVRAAWKSVQGNLNEGDKQWKEIPKDVSFGI